jgi:hypothetical protein
VRLRYTIIVLLISIVASPTISLTGQEEPLPAIQPKATIAFEPLTPEIVLAVDPIHDVVQPTLADAVRANDYATFDALYRSTPAPAFALLHELWTYSINDPVGAFYGVDLRDRISRAYPGFAEYIEQFRIIDSNGNAFYPTSETRAFLLDRAVEGRAPRVLLAETVTSTPRIRSVASRTDASRDVASSSVASGAPASPPAGPAASRRRAPAVVASKPAPTQAAARDAAVPAGEDAGAPPVAPPVITEAPVIVQAPATVPGPDNNFGSRGILLLVIGLVGIGILAMMLRAPREEQPTSIIPTQTTVPPPPVEPLRRPSAAPEPPGGKNRASGSHG